MDEFLVQDSNWSLTLNRYQALDIHQALDIYVILGTSRLCHNLWEYIYKILIQRVSYAYELTPCIGSLS